MKSFFENRASIIGGAMIGLIVGTGPLLAVTFSLFIKPATEDLGWPRAAFSGAGLVASLVGIVAAPILVGLSIVSASSEPVCRSLRCRR